MLSSLIVVHQHFLACRRAEIRRRPSHPLIAALVAAIQQRRVAARETPCLT
jgi:hypothetical protein